LRGLFQSSEFKAGQEFLEAGERHHLMRHVIVGTAGHIDHGKSALVKALTGTDPDRLKEEKLRGITIDLGFAHLDLGDLQIGFVDVPGHEKFVKNMLAGIGGIDFVLLVVAADESIMPQTREHFDICRLLGIQSGVVAITKSDAVEPELVELVREELHDAVAGSFLENARVVAVSSRTGDGIDELKRALRECATKTVPRRLDRILRLPVDRAFSIHGFGTVLTGTLTAGELHKEQEIELIPAGPTARVRGLQVHGSMTDRAVAGQRTAVNLQGIDLSQVSRGMVLTVPHRFQATRMLDARVTLLASARPLKNLVKLRFHQGTAEVLARIALMNQDTLAPGKSAFAQLRLDAPVFCLHGDAFIVRQFSPTVTIGGGRVLHPDPVKHRTTDREALALLEGLDRGTMLENIPLLVAAEPGLSVELSRLNALLGLPDSELKRVCAELVESGSLVMVAAPSPLLLLPRVVEQLENSTVELVSAFHSENPLLKGISREELRKRNFGGVPGEVFRFCLDRLVSRRKISLQEELVSLHGREVQLSSDGQQVRESIEGIYRHSGFQPPAVAELPAAVGAPPDEVRRIFFWMIKEKILVRVSEDLAYHNRTLEEIRNTIRTRFAPGDKFGVADFKELFDLTRKHAIPLLEFFDRERFTRRIGNDRVLL
jgi:selenocysteine-specific elongation factor